MSVKVADYIKAIRPYQPGKPISEVTRELGITDIVKLASNENPLGPSPRVVEAIKKAAEEVNLYPDGNGYYLKQALVEYHKDHGVKFEELVLGNGSNEVIELAMRALLFGDDEFLLSEQGFIVYELIARAMNVKTVYVPQKNYRYDLEGFIERITPHTKLIALVNPNNPTGTYYTKKEFEKLLSYVPEGAVVLVDEAYIDYVDAEDYPRALDYRRDFENLIVTRTFSKAFGIAGVRIGYGITTAEIADYMNRIREPFNTNLIAQAAAIAALEDREYLDRAVKVNREGKEYFYKEFERLGLEYLPSQTNFVLVKVGEGENAGHDAFEFMMKKGVIVRPMAGYNLPKWIRISIGMPDENRKAIAALEAFLNL